MTDNLFTFSPVANWVRSKPKGQFSLILDGLNHVPGGDFTSIDFTPSVDETDIYSNETPTPVLAMTDFGTPTIEIDIACRQLAAEFRHMLFWSAPGLVLNQALAADQTFDLLAHPGKGYRRRLPHREVTVTAVHADDDGGDPVEYIKNTHYRISKATGLIEITAHPADVAVDINGKADVTVEYDAAAITGRQQFGAMSNLDLRCGFNFISTNTWGHKQEVDVWTAQAKFDKIPLGADGNGFVDYSLKLKVYADPTQDAGYEFARIVDIPRE